MNSPLLGPGKGSDTGIMKKASKKGEGSKGKRHVRIHRSLLVKWFPEDLIERD